MDHYHGFWIPSTQLYTFEVIQDGTVWYLTTVSLSNVLTANIDSINEASLAIAVGWYSLRLLNWHQNLIHVGPRAFFSCCSYWWVT